MERGSVRRERVEKAIRTCERRHAERVSWLRDSVLESVRTRCGVSSPLDRDEVRRWIEEREAEQERVGDRIPLYLGRRRVDAYLGENLHAYAKTDIYRGSVLELAREADLQFRRQPLGRVALAALAAERLLLCGPQEAVELVLCDTAPAFRPIRVSPAFFGYPTLPEVIEVADQWLAAEDIAKLIVDARGELGVQITAQRRRKSTSESVDNLIRLVDELRPVSGRSDKNYTWQEVHREALAEGFPYDTWEATKQAYTRAVRTREAKGLRPKKGGETQ